jgi:hypothetical protein
MFEILFLIGFTVIVGICAIWAFEDLSSDRRITNRKQ